MERIQDKHSVRITGRNCRRGVLHSLLPGSLSSPFCMLPRPLRTSEEWRHSLFALSMFVNKEKKTYRCAYQPSLIKGFLQFEFLAPKWLILVLGSEKLTYLRVFEWTWSLTCSQEALRSACPAPPTLQAFLVIPHFSLGCWEIEPCYLFLYIMYSYSLSYLWSPKTLFLIRVEC